MRVKRGARREGADSGVLRRTLSYLLLPQQQWHAHLYVKVHEGRQAPSCFT